jgi:F-type H+-transporting ATPase subunit gamma
MPSTRELRIRIRSVTNTAKVTKAMQLIAASKMRRAQQMVLNGKAYSDRMQRVLGHLVGQLPEGESTGVPLLDRRPVQKTAMLLVTPDRGLAGALVGNLNRVAGTAIRESASPVSVVAVGRKGERFIARTGQDLVATFSVTDRPRLEDTVAISRHLINQYVEGAVDRVVLVFAEFVNTAVQKPTIRTLLPVEPGEDAAADIDYIFEPGAREVLETLAPRYVETQVYHAILEAIASEHSARMVSMKNATDNANQLVDDLTLELNKARQESITSELLDIVGGVAAMEG